MIGDIRRGFATLVTLPLWAFPTYADTAVPVSSRNWPNSFVARLEASLLIQTLNADLLSHDSATLTLERWCSAHRLLCGTVGLSEAGNLYVSGRLTPHIV